ncbi:MAG TPA: helix-turn-helix transcriptional regulator [Niabella sp.]|nr:helix-turn-helix transcriptional regulator [Niabella sp.]
MENLYSFSLRETDVIKLLLKGKSNNQIAQELSISTSTVEFHLRNIYAKLGVNSRTEAVLKLSEQELGKSTGAFSEKLMESVVDKMSNATDNDGQPTSRSMPMKSIKYIIGGAFATLITFLLLFINLQSKSTASAATATTDTELPPTLFASASPTQKVESCTFIHEVTFCIKGVALTKDFIYVMLEIKAPQNVQPDGMGFMRPSALEGETKLIMRDNLGNEYNAVDDFQSVIVYSGSDNQTYQQTLKFPRPDKEAKSATLKFPSIVTSIPLQSSISLDLGETHQAGQVISLDQTLHLQGQEIHLTKAELSGDGINALHIDIWSDPVKFKGDDISALMVMLGIPDGTNMGTGFGSRMILPDLPYNAFANLTYSEMQSMTGIITIPVNGINIYYEGNFEIPFSIPESGLYSKITPTLDQSAQMAEIRRFANSPNLDVTFITFEYVNNAIWSALYFTKDGSKYWVETQTRRIVQFENGIIAEQPTSNKSTDEIKKIAEQFVFANSLKFQKFYSDLVLSEKIDNNLYIFRWEYSKVENSGVESPFVQVAISHDGGVVGFTNTLDFFEP